MYRQSGTWSDYTESKLVSNCLPIREVTRAIRPTGRFNLIEVICPIKPACLSILDFEFGNQDSVEKCRMNLTPPYGQTVR